MVAQLANGDQVAVSQGREMFDLRAPKGSWGKGKRAVWDARIDDPFGRPTRMPLDVEELLMHGVVVPRKWLVQPESTMVRVLGTKVRGDVLFATFYLYLSSQPLSDGFIYS